MARLKKLQEAADILRRTSRFVILARRLQLQMNEMKTGASADSGDSLGDAGIEDERERAIAKAALTISEICECASCLNYIPLTPCSCYSGWSFRRCLQRSITTFHHRCCSVRVLRRRFPCSGEHRDGAHGGKRFEELGKSFFLHLELVADGV